MTDDQDPDWGLIMPFVVCQSQGGPFDDDAFTCGYECGQLDTRLAILRAIQGNEYAITITERSWPQADLILMRHGFAVLDKTETPGWVTAVIAVEHHGQTGDD